MDEKDKRILLALKENARLSVKEISKVVRLPITTVHNRIKKLKKGGVIEKYTVLVNNKKVGKNVTAYVMINVDYSESERAGFNQEEIVQKLNRLEGVEDAKIVTGRTDIVVKVVLSDIDELRKFTLDYVRKIPGVQKTETFVIMN